MDNQFLAELRAQRHQINTHLQWLDQKIEELEGSSRSTDADMVKQEASLPVKTESAPEVLAPGSSIPTYSQEAETPVTPAPEGTGNDFEISPTTYASSAATDIKRLKIGCTAFVVIASALFLFLLFGLPRFLDSEEETEQQNLEAPAEGF